MVRIGLVWDHPEPETVKYYNIYKSETQGDYQGPYDSTTKLPTDASPFILKLPVISGSRTIYLRVKAVNELGESPWSNEKEVEMRFIVNDVE